MHPREFNAEQSASCAVRACTPSGFFRRSASRTATYKRAGARRCVLVQELRPAAGPGASCPCDPMQPQTREQLLVLLVEDDADLAQVTQALLQQDGLRVAVAHDGREGLDL